MNATDCGYQLCTISITLTNIARNPRFPFKIYIRQKDIKYCKTCVISNQRPNSAVEYENHPGVNKSTINFDCCMFLIAINIRITNIIIVNVIINIITTVITAKL